MSSNAWKIYFFATKVENVKHSELKCKMCLIPLEVLTNDFSGHFWTLSANSKLKFGSPLVSMGNK